MEKISLEQRDIVLLPFPFSNQSGVKVRPAVILSNNEFNHSEDLIVAGITSNISKGKYTFQIDENKLELKNIKDNCCIKVENLLKIDKQLVIKKIDKVKSEEFEKLIPILNSIFSTKK